MSKLYVNEIVPKTSGREVKFPNKPFSQIRYTATANTASTIGRATFSSSMAIDKDVGGHMNTSDASWTCPEDGVYIVQLRWYAGSGMNDYLGVRPNVGGSGWGQFSYNNGDNYNDASAWGTFVVYADKGDVIYPELYGSAVDSNPNVQFTVAYIG